MVVVAAAGPFQRRPAGQTNRCGPGRCALPLRQYLHVPWGQPRPMCRAWCREFPPVPRKIFRHACATANMGALPVPTYRRGALQLQVKNRVFPTDAALAATARRLEAAPP